jgi:hypothetical protein
MSCQCMPKNQWAEALSLLVPGKESGGSGASVGSGGCVLHRSFLPWASAKFATFGIESFRFLPARVLLPSMIRIYLLPHQIIIRHSRQSSVRPLPRL